MRTVLAVWVLALAAQGSSPTGEQLIGLLTLPDVFGTGSCRFEPRPVPLFDAPRSETPAAEIRASSAPKLAPDGGCELGEVRVHWPDRAPTTLPSREYAYEESAAVVVARTGEWFRILTGARPLWLRAGAMHTFSSLIELLGPDQLAYLTSSWDRAMHATPGGQRLTLPALGAEPTVRVLGSRQLPGGMWLEVETTDSCNPDEPAVPKVRGWVPAYAPDGSVTVWFFSRGC
jgi:hypothetical protein